MFKNNIIRIILFSFMVGSNFNPTPQISFDEYTPINIHSYGLGLEDIISIKNYNADFPDVKFYLEGNQLYVKSVMNQSFFSMIEIEARDRDIIIPLISKEKSKVKFYIDKNAEESINIVGSFNDWNVEKDSMYFNGYVWEYDKYLEDGVHEYKFVMDSSHYFLDPFSIDSISDGLGNFNSLITIKSNNSPGNLYKKSEVHFNKNILLEFDYIKNYSNDNVNSEAIYVTFNNQVLNASQIRINKNNITVALDENNKIGLLSLFAKNTDDLLIEPNYTIIDENLILDPVISPAWESMLDLHSIISDNGLDRVEKRLVDNLNLSSSEFLEYSALSLGDIIMLYKMDNTSVWLQKYFNNTVLIASNNSEYNQSIQFDYPFNSREGELFFSKQEDRLPDSLEASINLPYSDIFSYHDSILVPLGLPYIPNDTTKLEGNLIVDSLAYNDSIVMIENNKIYLELKPYKILMYNMK